MADRVGFFDSGIGGTCILRAFLRLCPDVPTVYLADTANCPYGNRPPDEIVRLAERNAARLLADGCRMVVVACNTATAAAIDALRAKWPGVPFVGLEPALKPAALRSKSGVVGVLATAGTFNGRLYNETKARFAKNVTVLASVADEFVTAVERLHAGRTVDAVVAYLDRVAAAADFAALPADLRRLAPLVRRRVAPLVRAGADKIVLGCTHFPHLKALVAETAGPGVEVIDPSDAVARQARRVWLARAAANGTGIGRTA